MRPSPARWLSLVARHPLAWWALAIVALGALLWVLPLLPGEAVRFGATVVIVVAGALTVLTAAVGIAVTAVTAPLRPVQEVSILGRRLVAFARFALGVAAVFGTALVASIVTDSVQRLRPASETLDELWAVLGMVVAFGGVVFWIWLLVDLLRMRRLARQLAVRAVAAWLEPRIGVSAGDVGLVCSMLMSHWLALVLAFGLAPLFVVLGVTLLVEASGMQP